METNEEISSILSQINERIPNLEKLIESIQNEIPLKLNHSILNIKSAISSYNEMISLEPIPKARNAVPISEDHISQINLHERYLTKHLNNAFLEYFSELENKTKEIESKNKIPTESTKNQPNMDKFKELEKDIDFAFSKFNSKCQDLDSKISELQVQRKFRNSSNQTSSNIETQMKQINKDIEVLKNNISRTQNVIKSSINDSLESDTSKISENQNDGNHSNTKGIKTRIFKKVLTPLEEQKNKVEMLESQWESTRDTLMGELTNINFSYENIEKMCNGIQNNVNETKLTENKLQKIQDQGNKNIKLVQENIKEINSQLNKLTDNEDSVKMTFNVMTTFDKEQSTVDDLEELVDKLYDRVQQL
ncbi:hypothetical protein TRFO_35285 [Tritrichomonas foetus]|uniref:Uncharacterized protein n=1 Tax=Tritrichomonas foetus TaxID=1144522 RepID=A0A1J4JGK1_9EUKA|nr:hypothetical protein TRFO_35285 [Tritrichomonas foetus]|eukprot:OHS98310.1 hypothetical protein TRFO_35285 [Tritrichomonas foetus]